MARLPILRVTDFGWNAVPSIQAIVQRLAPELFEICAGVLLLPVGSNEIVAGRIGLTGEHGNEFQRTLGVVERSDQRLDDADGAVEGAGIAPGFEFMRGVDVPLAEFGGFVLIEAVVDAEWDLPLLSASAKFRSAGAS